MTLAEYAAQRQNEETAVERQIQNLLAQIREIDYRNDPLWSRRQDEEHNRRIFKQIDELRKAAKK